MIESNPSPAERLALARAADLQDNLLTANNDLERLQSLLDDSHATLQAGFFGALRTLHDLRAAEPSVATRLDSACDQLVRGAKALQFLDLATQLIAHTSLRLRNCAQRLAQDAFAGDEDAEAVVEAAPLRPNPVTQSEMDTGLVELF